MLYESNKLLDRVSKAVLRWQNAKFQVLSALHHEKQVLLCFTFQLSADVNDVPTLIRYRPKQRRKLSKLPPPEMALKIHQMIGGPLRASIFSLLLHI